MDPTPLRAGLPTRLPGAPSVKMPENAPYRNSGYPSKILLLRNRSPIPVRENNLRTDGPSSIVPSSNGIFLGCLSHSLPAVAGCLRYRYDGSR